VLWCGACFGEGLRLGGQTDSLRRCVPVFGLTSNLKENLNGTHSDFGGIAKCRIDLGAVLWSCLLNTNSIPILPGVGL
jgi:hypothetical protein